MLLVLIASFCEKLRLREPPGKNDLKRAQDFLLNPSKYLSPFTPFNFDDGTFSWGQDSIIIIITGLY